MSRQTIDADTAINSNGVLEKMVQQPTDGTLNVSYDNGATYVEIWKGSYADMGDVAARGGTVGGVTWRVGYARPTLNNNWVSLLPVPAPLSGMAWMVDNIEVSEIEAGEHGTMQITYKAVPESMLPMGGYGSETSSEIVTESTGWQLRWVEYSVDPLEYCTEGPTQYDDLDENEQHQQLAHADCVIKCAQLPKPRKSQIPDDMKENPTQYMWVEPNQAGESISADVRELGNEREQKIYNWHVRGMHAIYHRPVLSWTRTVEMPISTFTMSSNIDVGIDKIDVAKKANQDDTLQKCPFKLPDDYYWINIGTDTHMKYSTGIQKSTCQLTYETTWEGWKYYVKEWYGSDNERWKVGALVNNEMPDSSNGNGGGGASLGGNGGISLGGN